MRRSDIGLLLMLAALAIEAVWLTGFDSAITHGALIVAVTVAILPVAILAAIVRWLRRPTPEELSDDDMEEMLEDTVLATRTVASVAAQTGALVTEELAPKPVSMPAVVTGPAFVGTTSWGAAIVPTADGTRVIVVVMPSSDWALYERAEPFNEDMVLAVIITSRQARGILGGTRAARLAGLDHVYVAQPTLSAIDRGVVATDPVAVRVIYPDTVLGGVVFQPDPHGLRAQWPDGATALFGDAIPLARVFRPDVGVLIGGFQWSSLGEMRTPVPRLVPVPGVVGSADPHELAELLGHKGVSVSVSGPPRNTPLPVLGSEHDLVMMIVSGDLDRAEELAKRRQAVDPSPSRMIYQLGVIAQIRGDEATARSELMRAADAGVAEAYASLSILLANHRDPRALHYAQLLLDALPDEPTALRCALSVYLQLGETTGASRILVERGEILSDRDRRELAQLVERPLSLVSTPSGVSAVTLGGSYRLPQHARSAARVARAQIVEGHTDDAERLMRRAAALDPLEGEYVAELGAMLSRQGRDQDAIEVYNAAIDSGLHEILRFNRATAYVRMGQLPEAISDLQICVDLVEGWHAARINLCSALWGTGDAEGARRELENLRAEGAPEKWIDALAAQIQ